MALTTDPRRRESFMGLMPRPGELERSYEEVRVDDYLASYRATGRPPQPCPQQPTDPGERRTLGLPPLFVPHIERLVTNGTDPTATPITPPVLPLFKSPSPVTVVSDPNALPDAQVFQPTTARIDSATTSEPVISQCIVLQPLYSNFSFEELRCLAYRRGKKVAPEVLTSQAAVPTPPSLLISPPTEPSTSQQIGANVGGEMFYNISCTPQYSRHSPEELRIAYMKSGRQLNSDEIIAQNAVLRMS